MRIAGAAETDFEAIIAWTVEQFGPAQAGIYSETLSSAVQALVAGPAQPGVKARPEIGRGIFTLHVARNGRRGRHFVLFRADADPTRHQPDVPRILHDSMDLVRHVPAEP
ncbi:MAG: type II toxin-antitoxin system RelE/ParE family toxin [Steroidobacteraceae bacterium]